MIRPAQVLTLIVAGVVLAGAGVWLVSRHATDSSAEPEGQVLPLHPADLNAVTRLQIFKGDGSRTTLVRDATHWTVSQRDYPADSGQVRKLLLDLANLKVEEQKTADPALYPKLGVEEPRGAQAISTGLQIDVNGKSLGLIVGKTSGTSSVYVRVSGQAQSLLANPQLAPDADPRHWLDRTIVDIAPEQVTEIDLEPQDGPAYSIKRSAGGAAPDYTVSPLPKGRELADPSAPASQAGALAGLQLDDVRKAGTHAVVSHARFHTGDGLTLTITGIPEGETRHIALAAAGETPAAQQRAKDLNARLAGWEFELPSYRYEELFKPLEQLLKPKSSAPAAKAANAPRSPVAAPKTLPFGPQGQSGSGQSPVTPQQSH
jgi:hypothetical protein